MAASLPIWVTDDAAQILFGNAVGFGAPDAVLLNRLSTEAFVQTKESGITFVMCAVSFVLLYMTLPKRLLHCKIQDSLEP